MNDGDDPQRWSAGAADAPAQFAGLVRADEAAGPNDQQLASMLTGIAAQVGRPELAQPLQAAAKSGAVTSSATTASTSASTTASALPYVAGVGVIALIAIGVLVLRQDTTPSANPAPATQAHALPAPVPAPPVQPTAQPAPAPTVAPAQPAATPTLSAPTPVPADRKARVHERIATAVTNANANASADPVAELALLERAQHVLRSDPAAALALAEQHRNQFVRGTLAQEREVLAVDALLRLGRRAAAERRAHAFERRYPDSSHLVRVHDLLRSTP